jgi:hypothetical protein
MPRTRFELKSWLIGAVHRRLCEQVEDALEGQTPPTWRLDSRHRARKLEVADLAAGFWIVQCNSKAGAVGLTYAQFAEDFRKCRSEHCPRNKTAAILATLVDFGLIRKTGNYSARGRGNVYEA